MKVRYLDLVMAEKLCIYDFVMIQYANLILRADPRHRSGCDGLWPLLVGGPNFRTRVHIAIFVFARPCSNPYLIISEMMPGKMRPRHRATL